MPTILEETDTDEHKAQAIIDQYFRGAEKEETHHLHTMKEILKDKGDLVSKLFKALLTTSNTSTSRSN